MSEQKQHLLKVNIKDTIGIIGVVLVSLLLTLNRFHRLVWCLLFTLNN